MSLSEIPGLYRYYRRCGYGRWRALKRSIAVLLPM